ncbi:MAG: hypothetical protein WC455_20160 [Dehalococcoidia bacterium]|jgi:hypothetical protein
MARQKKWVYWHRVTWADNDCEEGAELKVGQLLGLDHRDTQCARLVRKESTKSIDIVDYVKLEFLGRMLRTASAEEVVTAFPKGEI